MNNKMKALDIIIPVHKFNEEVSLLLKRSLTSVNEMADKAKSIGIEVDLYIVASPDVPNNIIENIEQPIGFRSFGIYDNKDGVYDFCSQVNYAVNNLCKNDYFMVVEFDDIVTPKWVNMSLPYINERKKCPIFLPLVEAYDINNPTKPIHYINEIAWSSTFTENELGVLTIDALKDYCNFNITGAIINKNSFVKAGGLKPSIKLSFGYELILRLTNTFNESFVVPKVGYFHFVNREDSLTSEYYRTMTQEEGSWWIKLATEEYTYKKDRNKTYNPDNE